MSDTESFVVITFGHSRATDGSDVAALIRRQWFDADIEAVLDDSGAVGSYRLTLTFPDADSAADAAFRLRDLLAEMDCPAEFS